MKYDYHKKVESSNLSEVGWHEDNLYITFKSGKTYKYANVQFQTYMELVTAESCGKYFHQNIRSKYDYEIVTEQSQGEATH
jgi:hypothetical protein